MNMKKVLSLLTAAALSISSFAALTVTASAAPGDTFTLDDVVWEEDFTLVSNAGSTDLPFRNTNTSTAIAASGLKAEHISVFGEASTWKTDYVNWFGTGRRGVVSASVQVTPDQASNPYWTAYVILRDGTVAPTLTISGTAVSDAAMSANATIVANDGAKNYYIASCLIPKNTLSAGTYTVTWGGPTPSDIVAAGFGLGGTAAAVGTIYEAEKIFASSYTSGDITYNNNMTDSTESYIAAGEPFGALNTISASRFPNYAINNHGDALLRFDNISAGTYKLWFLSMEYNNRYPDIYLDGVMPSDGTGNVVSGNLTDKCSFANTGSRQVIVYSVAINIATSGTHYILIDNDIRNTIGVYAVKLVDARTAYSGTSISKDTSGSIANGYQRFNDNGGNPADAYMTSIDFDNQYAANGLKWWIYNGTDNHAEISAADTTFTGGTVYFGLVISGTAEQLDTITKVELR